MVLSFTDASWRLSFETSTDFSCACAVCSEGGYCGQTYGIALGDADGDGWLDLFANHHLIGPSEILYSFGRGTTAVSPARILENEDEHGAVFFDIDGDGDLDLLQGVGAGTGSISNPDNRDFWNKVLLNDDGRITSTNVADDFGLDYGPARGRIMVPLELEGRTGMLLASTARPDGDWASTILIQRNDGSFRSWGQDVAQSGDTFGIGARLDGDAVTDLVLVNGTTLRIHERGPDGTTLAPLSAGGFGQITDLVIGDFDGDLDADIFVAQGGTNPDKLLVRDGSGTWVNKAGAAGISGVPEQTISAVAGDFDNDGDLDIAALQFVEGLDIVFWINDGSGAFTRERLTDSDIPGRGSSLIVGDVNNDGVLDLVIATGDGAPTEENAGGYFLLEGDPTGNSWLSVTLDDARSTGGLGARVLVRTPDGREQMLEQDSGAHRWAQDDTRLHFGLGEYDRAEVRVIWADGNERSVGLIDGSRAITLRENSAKAKDLKGTDRDDVLTGGKGDDTIMGRDGKDKLRGKDGADLIRGNSGRDDIGGGDGHDELFGGKGSDVLRGGDGRDILVAGAGRDVLVGGSGADIFEFNRGDGRDNRIADMSPDRDVIRIENGARDFDDIRITERGGDTIIAFANVEVRLDDVDATKITAEDFFFV